MRKHVFWTLFPFFGMVILILDTKTALSGAAEGIALCLQTVIPSLFPFLVLSTMAASVLSGQMSAWLRPLGRLLRIPRGSELLLLIGLLGGYPTGATVLANAYREHRLSQQNCSRMLAFTSNAGPAFIFGFGADLFPDARFCWYLWGIHILSAWIVGILTVGGEEGTFSPSEGQGRSLSACMPAVAKTMAIICCWIVLFRVLLAFCHRWFLWRLPLWASTLLQGMAELSNGSVALYQIPDLNLRFLLFSLMLGFGGLCVTMQTFAVCSRFDVRRYLPGKVTQAIISVLICLMMIRRELLSILTFGTILLMVCGGYYFLSKPRIRTGFPVGSAVQ